MDKKKEAELTYRAALLDKRLKYLRSEFEKVVLLTTEMEKAKSTLKIEKNAEVLFPIGGGIMAFGTITDDKYIFPIGENYYIKVDRQTAQKRIEEKLEKIRQYYDMINEDVKKSEKELIEIMKEIRKLNAE